MKRQQPTPDQDEALQTFAKAHGRTWKSALRHAWETGIYPAGTDSMNLQQVRNSLGPTWLINYKPAKASSTAGTTEEAAR